jgi:hypothetical protein
MICPVCQSKPQQVPYAFSELKYVCEEHFCYFMIRETITGFHINITISNDSFLQFCWILYQNNCQIVMWNKTQPSIVFNYTSVYIDPSEAYRVLQRYYKLLTFS